MAPFQNQASVPDDAQIIGMYWARDEKAIEYTDRKYRRYLFTVAHNIVLDRLDCEECLNDTYLGAWNAIPPSRPNVLKAFLTVILRRSATRRYHKNLRKRAIPSEMTVSLSELGEFVVGDAGADSAFDAARLGHVLTLGWTAPCLVTLLSLRSLPKPSLIFWANKSTNIVTPTTKEETALVRNA